MNAGRGILNGCQYTKSKEVENFRKYGIIKKKRALLKAFLEENADFYKKISKGGIERILPNGKGVQTTFADNSSVVYRVITKTPNSPAVEITFKTPGKIKPQKIHFIK